MQPELITEKFLKEISESKNPLIVAIFGLGCVANEIKPYVNIYNVDITNKLFIWH